MRGPGGLFVRQEPLAASRQLTVGFLESDGEIPTASYSFAPGEAVQFQNSLSIGTYRLTVDRQPCDGPVEVRLLQETDVVLRVAADACEAAVDRIHDGDAGHPVGSVRGTVDGVPRGTRVSMRPIDDASRPPPPPTEIDESGLFMFPTVSIGRYRVEVTVNGAVTASAEVTVTSGGPQSVDLVVPR